MLLLCLARGSDLRSLLTEGSPGNTLLLFGVQAMDPITFIPMPILLGHLGMYKYKRTGWMDGRQACPVSLGRVVQNEDQGPSNCRITFSSWPFNSLSLFCSI